jgi:hypothetical protein
MEYSIKKITLIILPLFFVCVAIFFLPQDTKFFYLTKLTGLLSGLNNYF